MILEAKSLSNFINNDSSLVFLMFSKNLINLSFMTLKKKSRIHPTATKYQSSLLDNVIKMEQVIGKEEGDMLSAENISLVKQMAQHVAEIRRLVAELVERRKVANRISSERDKAIAYHDTVAPMLEEIRGHIDQLELVVDNELWTLPKYRELLFIV